MFVIVIITTCKDRFQNYSFNDPLRKEFVHSCYYDEQKLYLSFATHSYDFSTHSHIEIYCTHVLLSFNNYNIQDCDMHEAGYKM